MKKTLAILLSLMLALSLCAGASAEEISGSYSWGVASLGSSAQMVASAIATVVTEHYPQLSISVQATAGSSENIRLIRNDEIDIANVNDAYNAATAQGAYEGEPETTLWALFNMYENAYVVCVLEDSPIQSMDDLVGKRVNLGPAGSGVYNAAAAMFESYGLLDQITVTTYSYTDANDQLKQGSIDALVGLISGEVPSTALAELDNGTAIRVIPTESERLQSAYEKYPDYADGKIHAGCINAVKEDMQVMAGFTIEYADERMSDEVAYAIVKTVYENVDQLSTYHQIASTLSVDTALNGIPAIVKVHPGAAKYFKEIGIWREDLEVAER
ncbi:MAG: TAXI family TRAP transporter solute-binding subunit [Clostridia bacterium]|nr:TAXI family TRAP transporter solute-binding subunit [Clostridia bacterium]